MPGVHPSDETNALTASLNASGCSRFDRWPAPSMTTSRAPGDLVAMLSRRAGGVSASSWPTTISVGTRIVASVGRRVGPVAQRLQRGDDRLRPLRRADALALPRRTSAVASVAGPSSFGSICSTTADGGLRRGEGDQLVAVGLGGVVVRLGLRVGQDQAAQPVGVLADEGEGDVAAHRQAAEDDLLA